jgi:hypothetical protein
MFESIIDPVFERLTPHVTTGREYAVMFCTGVIERLERIADAVEGDNEYTVRREYHGFSASGPAAVTIEVPSTDTWTLESVVARTVPAAGSTLDLREQPGGRLRFANDIATSGALTGIFSPLHFNGGTVLVATMAQPGEFHLTFKMTRQMPKRHSMNGWRNPGTDRLDQRQEIENDARHTATFFPHPPMTGPSSRDAQTGLPPT